MVAPDDLARSYAAAWTERDDAKRRELLESCCSPVIRFLQEGWEHEVVGVGPLSDTIGEFQAGWPDGVVVRVELTTPGRLASRFRTRRLRVDLRRGSRLRNRLRRARERRQDEDDRGLRRSGPSAGTARLTAVIACADAGGGEACVARRNVRGVPQPQFGTATFGFPRIEESAVSSSFVFGRATTAAEIEAVQRLRYEVYVEELDRYRDAAGAVDGRFVEPEDDHSWIFYARVGDEMVASTRPTWGGSGFSERQIDQYGLAPLLEEIPPELMAVGERNSVLPMHRGSGVIDALMEYGKSFAETYDLRVVIGCCEPHLLSLYLKMGCRPYAEQNINSESAGYLIPIISFVPDVEAFRGVGSAKSGDLPECIERVLARSGSVRSQVLSGAEEYWGDVRRTLDELNAQRISAFDGFADDEAQRCIARATSSNVRRGTVCSNAAVRRAISSSCSTERSKFATAIRSSAC